MFSIIKFTLLNPDLYILEKTCFEYLLSNLIQLFDGIWTYMVFYCFHFAPFRRFPVINRTGWVRTNTGSDRIGLNYRIGPDRTRFSVLWSFFLRYFILYAQLEEVYSIQNYFYLTPSFQYKKTKQKKNKKKKHKKKTGPNITPPIYI